MKLFVICFILVLSVFSFAGVAVYTGTSGEIVYLESSAKLAKNTFLIKIEGIDSKWSGHVFQVKQYSLASGERYSFDYEEELSTGKRSLTYEIIVADGTELVKGTQVKKIKLFYQEAKGKPISLTWNSEKTELSQKINLFSDFKKNPYKPQVD